MGGENEGKPKFNYWAVAQGITTAILLAVIFSGGNFMFALRDSDRDGRAKASRQGDAITADRIASKARDDKLDAAIKALANDFYKFKSDGKRYSADDGLEDRVSSKARDAELGERIDDLADRTHTKRAARSERELLKQVHAAMDEKIEKNAENNVRQWLAIRQHISIPAHKGAEYQFETINDHLRGLRVLKFKGDEPLMFGGEQ